MKKHLILRLHERDNVAVAVRDIAGGEMAAPGVNALRDIPQAHKIALKDIPEGGEVIRYGAVIGYALAPVRRGDWVHEAALRLPDPPALHDMPWGQAAPPLPRAPLRTFEGYPDAGGGYAGTRNLLGIHTTVQCVAGVVNMAAERIRRELLPRYPHVEGIAPLTHAFGCGVAIDAPGAAIPLRTLRHLVHHPNFGGEVMAVGLGCEPLHAGLLLDARDNTQGNVILLQQEAGFDAMVAAILRMAERKLERLNRRRRQVLPLSQLMIGLQCGGSDAFSGMTANPVAGYAADLLVEAGGTVLFSEVTEVRDAVHLIARRCVDEACRDRLAQEMRWYDDYLRGGQVDRSVNPSPGNREGGLSNIVEKTLGAIAKSGTAPIVQVLSPAERPTRRGMIFAATPASDFVCGPCQLASGITLQVFMTGRGTPYGLAAAPVIKVSSRTELKEQWGDLIDFDAGPAATGGSTIPRLGEALFRQIVDVASGRIRPAAERYGIHNDLCLFNPAPIT
ncbi:MAG: galactarate dehydratase [Clostridiales bacterium]|nr:galactarate dehydratase [Clostridiales bacterium]